MTSSHTSGCRARRRRSIPEEPRGENAVEREWISPCFEAQGSAAMRPGRWNSAHEPLSGPQLKAARAARPQRLMYQTCHGVPSRRRLGRWLQGDAPERDGLRWLGFVSSRWARGSDDARHALGAGRADWDCSSVGRGVWQLPATAARRGSACCGHTSVERSARTCAWDDLDGVLADLHSAFTTAAVQLFPELDASWAALRRTPSVERRAGRRPRGVGRAPATADRRQVDAVWSHLAIPNFWRRWTR
jgi:hypothetical protein